MYSKLHKTGVACLVFAALAVSALPAQAQGASTRDLNLEQPAQKPPKRSTKQPQYSGPVQVSVMTVGSSTIPVGKPVRIKMVSLADGFGHLYVLNASGRTQLWMENVPIRAGQPLTFPRGGLVLRAAPPTGDDTIIFAASKKRIDGFIGTKTSTRPVELQLTHSGLQSSLQGKFSDFAHDDWAFAEIKVRITD